MTASSLRCEGTPLDSRTRRLAHEPLGWASVMRKPDPVPFGITGYSVVDLYWLVEDTNAGTIRFRTNYLDSVVGTHTLGGSAGANAIQGVPAVGVANVRQRLSCHLPTSYVVAESF
jgi:hypothetical protein